MGEEKGQESADSAPAGETTVVEAPQTEQGPTVPSEGGGGIGAVSPTAEEGMPEGLGERAQERFRQLARERKAAKEESERLKAEAAAAGEARQKLEFDVAMLNDRVQQLLQPAGTEKAKPDPYETLVSAIPGFPPELVNDLRSVSEFAKQQRLAAEERLFQEHLDAAEDVASQYGDTSFNRERLERECWNRGLDPLAVEWKQAKQAAGRRAAGEKKGQEQAVLNAGVGAMGPSSGTVPAGTLPQRKPQGWNGEMLQYLKDGDGVKDDF